MFICNVPFAPRLRCLRYLRIYYFYAMQTVPFHSYHELCLTANSTCMVRTGYIDCVHDQKVANSPLSTNIRCPEQDPQMTMEVQH